MNEEKKQRLAAYKRIEAANLMAQADIDQLDDVSQWMSEVPQWLNETEKEVSYLPDTLEQKIPMLNLIKVARKTHQNNEPMLTMRFIKEIQENWNNAIHDKGISARFNSRIGRKNAGVTRTKQLEEQANKTKDAVLKLYELSKLPERNRATVISKQVGITAARVRQIVSEGKKSKNDVR